MNEFSEEVQEKRKIASGARHKKGKRGGRKVMLPCDNMTPAQIKQKSGEVVTYNIGGPLDWEHFLALPDDLQRVYIDKLHREYRATDQMLAEMFGVSRPTVCTLRKRLDVQTVKRADDPATKKAQKWQWEQFLGEGGAGLSLQTIPAETTAEPLPLAHPHKIVLEYAGAWPAILASLARLDVPGEMTAEIKIKVGGCEND